MTSPYHVSVPNPPQGPYTASWNSLKRHTTPAWFQEVKFGIYTHWGIYSVPAFGKNVSWYPHFMYKEGNPQYEHHVATYGDPSQFGYKDFIPEFTGAKFDADEWAEIFQRSGARYAGPVGEHHDGFSLWDSKHNDWNAAKMGPKRDIVGELEKAMRKLDMKYMVALHHAENWWFFPHWKADYDTADPAYAGLYGEAHNLDGKVGPKLMDQDRPNERFMRQWLAKIYEVIDNYSPDLLWFDFGLRGVAEQWKTDFCAYYYNRAHERGQEVVLTYKSYDLAPGAGTVDLELGRMNNLTYFEWLTDTTVDDGSAWGYVKDTPYKSTTTLVHYLVDNVSKNGYLLLNVGPKPDGTLPPEAVERLNEMGKWMEVNGESIYGTTNWISYGEGPTQMEKGGSFNEKDVAGFTAQDVRFAVKDNVLYATVLGWPGAEITIETLKRLYAAEIEAVTMLGSDQPLKWKLHDKGLTIETPAERPGDHAYVFKIVRGEPYPG
jgi:alpha-L-fucosidase